MELKKSLVQNQGPLDDGYNRAAAAAAKDEDLFWDSTLLYALESRIE